MVPQLTDERRPPYVAPSQPEFPTAFQRGGEHGARWVALGVGSRRSAAFDRDLTRSAKTLGSVSVQNEDIVICDPISYGPGTTSCTWRLLFDGSASG
jgi:hypothetical protein